MRSLRWAIIQYSMTGVLVKGRNLNTDMYRGKTEGPREGACDCEGRDVEDALKRQGMPKIASKPPEVRSEA